MFVCFGCGSPKLQRNSVNAVQFEELSDQQISQMQSCWQQLESKDCIGQSILTSLISAEPAFASFFGVENTEPEEFKKNKKFLVQAQRVQSLIDITITSIGIVSEQTIRDYSRHVGSIHFYHGVNFSGSDWVCFVKSMNKELDQLSNEAALADVWEALVEMIVSEMKMGFLAEATAQFKSKTIEKAESLKISASLRPILSRSASNICELSMVTSKAGNKMTEKDMHQLCKESWLEAKNTNIGVKILLSLIVSKPAFGRHFGVERKMTPYQMEVLPSIKVQGSRIQAFLDRVITLYSVVPNSKISDMCAAIGRIHFRKGINFTADNWLLFKRVTIEQVMEAGSRKRSFRQRVASVDDKMVALQKAWHALMNFVIRSMKDGFLEAASGI